ncbi:hypothetical protein [Burkholderia dolosa]|uniref:hypothetical protein n=1 Tax=Burkholderia dolosa TaxID=152500 RepID=UPI001592A496|nr:hypothetical protein [Burkholderia dolosa]MBR8301511.1 hypothetical protein [Burkholderia dolosa]MBY4751991.1 hypothetical protein [Burkholderia dolosa]
MTLENLASPTWWLTAVAGAIVLKLVSDYIRLGLEKLVGKSFEAWAARSEASRARFASTVARLTASRNLRDQYFQREMRMWNVSILLLLISIFNYGLIAGVLLLDSRLQINVLPFASLVAKNRGLAIGVLIYCVIGLVGVMGSIAASGVAFSKSKLLDAAARELEEHTLESVNE